jgi:hypothetical protein
MRGDRPLSLGNNVPFAQLTTSSASDVILHGVAAIRRPSEEIVQVPIETRLSDIFVGQAPLWNIQPMPPTTPVISPPTGSPVINPPVIPPATNPNLPPVAPVHPAIDGGVLSLTAEINPVAGLDGFNNYRITATSNLGNIVGFDFTQSGSFGISGPMNQVSAGDAGTIFNNSVSGILAAQDSHFLFNGDDIISLLQEESPNTLQAAFAARGDKQLTLSNSVPFVQIATPSASDVILHGMASIQRTNGEFVLMPIDAKLSDILVGAAPALDLLPIAPPVQEPVAVSPPSTTSPVDTPQTTVPPSSDPQPEVGTLGGQNIDPPADDGDGGDASIELTYWTYYINPDGTTNLPEITGELVYSTVYLAPISLETDYTYVDGSSAYQISANDVLGYGTGNGGLRDFQTRLLTHHSLANGVTIAVSPDGLMFKRSDLADSSAASSDFDSGLFARTRAAGFGTDAAAAPEPASAALLAMLSLWLVAIRRR